MIRTKEDAKRALSECGWDQGFFMCDGRRIDSIPNLLKALKHTSADIYDYHVSDSKNDFANWINDIFQDSKLARDIYHKSKTNAIKLISLRIKQLKKRTK